MKVARFVLKIVGLSLACAAAICGIIAYWDKITDFFFCVQDRFGDDDGLRYDEYSDYADWDE